MSSLLGLFASVAAAFFGENPVSGISNGLGDHCNLGSTLTALHNGLSLASLPERDRATSPLALVTYRDKNLYDSITFASACLQNQHPVDGVGKSCGQLGL